MWNIYRCYVTIIAQTLLKIGEGGAHQTENTLSLGLITKTDHTRKENNRPLS